MHIVAAPGGETPVNIANRYNNHCDQLGHKSGLQNVPIRALASELDHRTILKPNHRGQHWNHFLTLYNNGLPLFSVDTMIPLFEYSLPLILNWIPAPSFSASQCLLSFRVIPGAGEEGGEWNRRGRTRATWRCAHITQCISGRDTRLRDPLLASSAQPRGPLSCRGCSSVLSILLMENITSRIKGIKQARTPAEEEPSSFVQRARRSPTRFDPL